MLPQKKETCMEMKKTSSFPDIEDKAKGKYIDVNDDAIYLPIDQNVKRKKEQVSNLMTATPHFFL